MDAHTRFDARAELQDLVNLPAGWLDRRIFWEEWIYQLELERLFAICGPREPGTQGG